MTEPDPLGITYDPTELCFSVSDQPTRGELLVVYLFPEDGEDTEPSFLLRLPEGENPQTEATVEKACRYWMREYGPGEDTDWTFDWGHASASGGESGIWVPGPHPTLQGPPLELEDIAQVFVVSEPPLGASRGSERHRADFRWLYWVDHTTTTGQPIKRASALRNELRRVLARPETWPRISYPLRHDPSLVLRMVPGPQPAVVLLSTTPGDPWPCRVRVDLGLMIDFLDRRL